MSTAKQRWPLTPKTDTKDTYWSKTNPCLHILYTQKHFMPLNGINMDNLILQLNSTMFTPVFLLHRMLTVHALHNTIAVSPQSKMGSCPCHKSLWYMARKGRGHKERKPLRGLEQGQWGTTGEITTVGVSNRTQLSRTLFIQAQLAVNAHLIFCSQNQEHQLHVNSNAFTLYKRTADSDSTLTPAYQLWLNRARKLLVGWMIQTFCYTLAPSHKSESTYIQLQ